MSKKYHVRERVFLNLKPEMRAYVIAVVEDTRDRQDILRLVVITRRRAQDPISAHEARIARRQSCYEVPWHSSKNSARRSGSSKESRKAR